MASYLRHRVVNVLRWYWVTILFIGEVFVFFWLTRSCQWPEENITKKQSTYSTNTTRVAIIADPQIVDAYSYGQSGLALKLTEFFTDIYLRKSFIFLQLIHKPSALVVLGDLMDGGREWADAQWTTEFERYKSIFTPRSQIPIYNMAGNHDIGIGNTIVEHALARFHSHIGPTNQVVAIGGHDLVFVDTLTLESDSARINQSSVQLVEDLQGTRPRLLFSHVPLWRPPKTPCGTLRQSRFNYLLNRRGYQFRDQLFENTTAYLLDKVRPVAVFSGDDHDTCTVFHPERDGVVPVEYTIGAFGWASGVPIASYGLLTVGDSYAFRNCFLPGQLDIYKMYLCSFVISLCVLIWVSVGNSRRDVLLPGPAGLLEPRERSDVARAGWRLWAAFRAVAEVGVCAYVAFTLFYYVI